MEMKFKPKFSDKWCSEDAESLPILADTSACFASKSQNTNLVAFLDGSTEGPDKVGSLDRSWYTDYEPAGQWLET